MSATQRTTGRWTLLIGLLAVFTLAAGCCCRHARRGGRHHWKHGHMRGPCRCKGGHMGRHFVMMGHGKMGHHKKSWIMKFMVHAKMLQAKLGLTQDQINKMKALRTKYKDQMRAFRLNKKRAKAQVMVELLKDKPDAAKLKALYKPVLEAKAAKMHAKLDMKIAFIQIFTAEQWRKIISSPWFGKGQWGRKGMSRHKDRGWGRGWGRKWKGRPGGRGPEK